MKRVALLVTGETEEALLQSLERIFPPEVKFLKLPRLEGFTSRPLVSPPPLQALGTAARRTRVEVLAAALVAAVEPGKRDREPLDLVVLIDDLELDNQAWPERAVEHVRTAVHTLLEQKDWPTARTRERAYERVRERCSFHLLVPMVEAYFFREPAALVRAGATRASLFDASAADVETRFEVNDPDFLAPPNRPRDEALPPWATANRGRHPKHYLQFLCDPMGKIERAYTETKGGQAALRDLDWDAVLASLDHVCFLRSFIHDLADALGEYDVAERFAGETHPLTWPPPRDNLLRNV